MKVLILSDIHGNLPALEAVIKYEKDYDGCIFLGDVVDYGPFPKECVNFLMENMDFGVIGNHDNAIAFNVDCGCKKDFKQFSLETRAWHRTLLGEKEILFLKSLHPMEQTAIDGVSIFMAHATPEGDLTRYLQLDEIDEAVRGITTRLVLLGHTHIQFKKNIGNSVVINPGSVGLSRDVPGACYATLENGNINLKNIPYDIDRTVFALEKSPISMNSKKGLADVLYGKYNR